MYQTTYNTTITGPLAGDGVTLDLEDAHLIRLLTTGGTDVGGARYKVSRHKTIAALHNRHGNFKYRSAGWIGTVTMSSGRLHVYARKTPLF